jgi:hypothetical protein
MTRLEELEQFAYDEGIQINDRHISDTKKGMFFCIDNASYITLDEEALFDTKERTATLAEEIGHYITGAFYFLETMANYPSARTNRYKTEYRARAWSYERLLPPTLIQKALDAECYYGEQAVAEYCNVPIEFLADALDYYVAKGLVFVCPEFREP